METYLWEVLLGHGEDIAGIGEEYIATLAVESHILILATLEFSELPVVVALYPAGFVEADGLPSAFGVVLVLETILYDFELELADGADDLATVELIDEELGYAFIHELGDAFLELLGLHRVGILDVFEHLGREGGQASEMEVFAFGEGVAYLEDAVVGKAYDVAGPCLIDCLLALGHELCWRGETHRLSLAYMEVGGVADEFAGTYLAEGDT